jgi:hypothetical protein
LVGERALALGGGLGQRLAAGEHGVGDAAKGVEELGALVAQELAALVGARDLRPQRQELGAGGHGPP